jgi:hypothetical protein
MVVSNRILMYVSNKVAPNIENRLNPKRVLNIKLRVLNIKLLQMKTQHGS